MDFDARKRLIFFKASANNQRRTYEALLDSLESPLSEALRFARCIYTPESHDIITTFLPAIATGIGAQNNIQPPGYHYTEVAWPSEALALVQQIQGIDPATSCYLLLTLPNVIRQGEVGYWVSNYPLFVVDFAFAKQAIPQLWSVAEDFLAIVGCQLEFGLIIDHYSGYLEHDPNPSEIVYQVARWPADAV
ncbi:hypothetical protein [Vacuolonema iberomarrocanum]|uniref:hypothetical protein n=1 Tax=Vacuolonema iberomarrocanum TaxID=3454632 RepID=UPI0019FD8B7C|nr:hypothetical protein [filamentous cyanobacterium LEGE 07170]